MVPLKIGYSGKTISNNIASLISAGLSKKHAASIAYSIAREAAKRIPDRRRRQAIMRRLSKE